MIEIKLNKEELNFLETLRKKPVISLKAYEDDFYLVEITEKEEEKINKNRIKMSSVKSLTTKEDRKYLRRVCSNPKLRSEEKENLLLKYFEIDKETFANWLEELGLSIGVTQYEKALYHKLKKKKRYLISSAQTASPVNLQFLNNMKAYAKYIDAEIGIIATRYKNPTSIWIESGDVWDKEVFPYLTAMRQDLHPDLCLLADLKLQATTPTPTSGLDGFEGHKSCIVGAPTVELRSVATLPNQKQKFLYSTGSVTLPNFTDTVTGGKAAERHSYGFIIVEIENDNIVHVRNVFADNNGNFNDLIYRIENQKIKIEPTSCFVWGDSHFAQKDENVTNAFRKLCKDLKIDISVLHDVWDSQSLNIHNLNNPIIKHKLEKEGKDDLKKELNQMYRELKWFEENMKATYVVASNHDDMLDRAMYQGDWRDNLKNAKIFVDMLALTLSGKAPNGIIPYYINKKYKNIHALGLNDSFILYGTELALHGHKGPNGSKGSMNAFAKLVNDTITAHGHAPMIKWNSVRVGISCKEDHGYNSGLSGWAYAGCTLNKYGQKQLIILNRESLTYTTLY